MSLFRVMCPKYIEGEYDTPEAAKQAYMKFIKEHLSLEDLKLIQWDDQTHGWEVCSNSS